MRSFKLWFISELGEIGDNGECERSPEDLLFRRGNLILHNLDYSRAGSRQTGCALLVSSSNTGNESCDGGIGADKSNTVIAM
jgi:hypothetical protein